MRIDEPTRAFYSAFAGELAEQYEAAQPEVERLLRAAFDPGMRVLDVGAGTGRDVALLLRMGRDAYGVEPCDELRELGLDLHPELQGRLDAGALPHLGRPFGGGCDGVLCSGVLNHVPAEELTEAVTSIRELLKDGGKLLLAIPLGPLDTDENNRDRHGRLITPLDPYHLRLCLEQAGLRRLDSWDFPDAQNRKGYSWQGLLFQRVASTVWGAS